LTLRNDLHLNRIQPLPPIGWLRWLIVVTILPVIDVQRAEAADRLECATTRGRERIRGRESEGGEAVPPFAQAAALTKSGQPQPMVFQVNAGA